MTYDVLNRTSRIDGPFLLNPVPVTMSFTYDTLDRRTQVEDSFGLIVSNYDLANQLREREMWTSFGTYKVVLDYNQRG
jgi:hypothetical protein